MIYSPDYYSYLTGKHIHPLYKIIEKFYTGSTPTSSTKDLSKYFTTYNVGGSYSGNTACLIVFNKKAFKSEIGDYTLDFNKVYLTSPKTIEVLNGYNFTDTILDFNKHFSFEEDISLRGKTRVYTVREFANPLLKENYKFLRRCVDKHDRSEDSYTNNLINDYETFNTKRYQYNYIKESPVSLGFDDNSTLTKRVVFTKLSEDDDNIYFSARVTQPSSFPVFSCIYYFKDSTLPKDVLPFTTLLPIESGFDSYSNSRSKRVLLRDLPKSFYYNNRVYANSSKDYIRDYYFRVYHARTGGFPLSAKIVTKAKEEDNSDGKLFIPVVFYTDLNESFSNPHFVELPKEGHNSFTNISESMAKSTSLDKFAIDIGNLILNTNAKLNYDRKLYTDLLGNKVLCDFLKKSKERYISPYTIARKFIDLVFGKITYEDIYGDLGTKYKEAYDSAKSYEDVNETVDLSSYKWGYLSEDTGFFKEYNKLIDEISSEVELTPYVSELIRDFKELNKKYTEDNNPITINDFNTDIVHKAFLRVAKALNILVRKKRTPTLYKEYLRFYLDFNYNHIPSGTPNKTIELIKRTIKDEYTTIKSEDSSIDDVIKSVLKVYDVLDKLPKYDEYTNDGVYIYNAVDTFADENMKEYLPARMPKIVAFINTLKKKKYLYPELASNNLNRVMSEHLLDDNADLETVGVFYNYAGYKVPLSDNLAIADSASVKSYTIIERIEAIQSKFDKWLKLGDIIHKAGAEENPLIAELERLNDPAIDFDELLRENLDDESILNKKGYEGIKDYLTNLERFTPDNYMDALEELHEEVVRLFESYEGCPPDLLSTLNEIKEENKKRAEEVSKLNNITFEEGITEFLISIPIFERARVFKFEADNKKDSPTAILNLKELKEEYEKKTKEFFSYFMDSSFNTRKEDETKYDEIKGEFESKFLWAYEFYPDYNSVKNNLSAHSFDSIENFATAIEGLRTKIREWNPIYTPSDSVKNTIKPIKDKVNEIKDKLTNEPNEETKKIVNKELEEFNDYMSKPDDTPILEDELNKALERLKEIEDKLTPSMSIGDVNAFLDKDNVIVNVTVLNGRFPKTLVITKDNEELYREEITTESSTITIPKGELVKGDKITLTIDDLSKEVEIKDDSVIDDNNDITYPDIVDDKVSIKPIKDKVKELNDRLNEVTAPAISEKLKPYLPYLDKGDDEKIDKPAFDETMNKLKEIEDELNSKSKVKVIKDKIDDIKKKLEDEPNKTIKDIVNKDLEEFDSYKDKTDDALEDTTTVNDILDKLNKIEDKLTKKPTMVDASSSTDDSSESSPCYIHFLRLEAKINLILKYQKEYQEKLVVVRPKSDVV